MERTQIYMTSEQKSKLAMISAQTGESQSALIRAAIDRLIVEDKNDKAAQRKAFLNEFAGMWEDDPERTQEYFAAIRASADARVKRLWGGFSDQEQDDFKAE